MCPTSDLTGSRWQKHSDSSSLGQATPEGLSLTERSKLAVDDFRTVRLSKLAVRFMVFPREARWMVSQLCVMIPCHVRLSAGFRTFRIDCRVVHSSGLQRMI